MDIFTEDFFVRVISTLIGAFSGATLAFLFAGRRAKIEKKEQEEAYLKYTICCLNYMLSDVINMRVKVANPRMEDAKKIKENVKEEYRNIGKKFTSKKLSSGIELEKLSFLAKHNSNIIMLVKYSCDNYEAISNHVEAYNTSIDRASTNSNSNIQNMNFLVSATECLAGSMNDAHYLVKKSSEELMAALILHYNSKKFSGFELTDKKYENLKIEPIESFEKQEYFSHKLKKKK